jgi:hypothetical protein
MIINQGDIVNVIVIPTKDQPPLIVDPNAEEAIQIAFERLQPVAGWHLQVHQTVRSIQDIQFT